VKPGDMFKATSKLGTREYAYLGIDNNYPDPCYNIAIKETSTGEVSHVELEWFKQRKILEVPK